MSLSSPKEEDERFLHVNDGGGGRGNGAGGGGDTNSESNSFNSGIVGGGSGERPPSLAPGLRRRVPSLARIGHVNSGKRY